MFDRNKFTEICCKYRITPTQLYVLYLVYMKDSVNLYKYTNENEGFDIENDLLPLIDKGYLLNFSNVTLSKGDFLVDQLHVTDAFAGMIFIDSEDAGEELFKTYPHYLKINGQLIVAKSCDKDKYKLLYARKIGNDVIKHKTIIDAIKILKDDSKINVNIKNFIEGELWDAFIELANGENGTSKVEVYGA